MDNMEENILKFLGEVGHLKRIPRSGWLFIGITHPESVAEHSFRMALVGYLLALLEEADTEKVLKMCLLHDLAEARLLDLPSRTRSYIPNKERIEEEIFRDMVNELPIQIRSELLSLFNEYINQSSNEAIIVKDADKLEMMIQAVEYATQGYDTEEWVLDAITSLNTNSAKKIAAKLSSVFNSIKKEKQNIDP
jgi:putative hydrolase of HD superfamily